MTLDLKVPPESVEKANQVFQYLQTREYDALNRLEKVAVIYQAVDDWNRHQPHTCTQGCRWCCKVKVEILPIEALFIGINTQPTPPPDEIDYCPFLSRASGQCKIYAVRPFNCRAYLSYDDPKKCENNENHFSTGGPRNGYGSAYMTFLAQALVAAELDEPINFDVNREPINFEINRESIDLLKQRTKEIRTLYGNNEIHLAHT